MKGDYKFLIEKIENNMETGVHSIDLSDYRLSSLPDIISDFTSLQTINLSKNTIVDLSPLKRLSFLKEIYLSENGLEELSILVNLTKLEEVKINANSIENISPLSYLKRLKFLDISDNVIEDITPLSQNVNLKYLDLNNNLINDLEPISKLVNLEYLYLNNNEITDISFLSSLINLKKVELRGNKIIDISPLKNLSKLESISLEDNKILDITSFQNAILNGFKITLNSKVSNFIKFNKFIRLANNPIETPPIEILNQGDKAVLNYFQQVEEQGIDFLYEAKMIVVGEGGVGKTTLVRKLKNRSAPMPKSTDRTKGIDIMKMNFDYEGKNFIINMWDFGGQEIYKATHQFFLTKRSLYVLVDDSRREDKTFDNGAFKYWLQTVELFSGSCPLLILQNEKGGYNKELDIGAMKYRFNFIKDVHITNLLTNEGLDTFERDVKHHILSLDHIGQPVPKAWIPIREDLIKLSELENYIDTKQYIEICKKHGIKNERDAITLSQYLHDLGTFLHFQEDEILSRIIILNNEWATNAVYKILDDQDVIRNKGIFDKLDMKRIWSDQKFKGKEVELRTLMEKFELCYRLNNLGDKFLVPQLLSASIPINLNWDSHDNIQLKYVYDFMPKGLMSRLIVRLHDYNEDKDLSWRSGFLAKYLNSTALIIETYVENEIHVRIKGRNKFELRAIVSGAIEKLHSSYSGIKVTKLIPCNCKACLDLKTPNFYQEFKIRERISLGKRTIECSNPPFLNADVYSLLKDEKDFEVVLTEKSIQNDDNEISIKEKVRNHISNGDVKKALSLIERQDQLFDEDTMDIIATMQSRYNRNKRKNIKGLLNMQELEVETNKIVSYLLDIIKPTSNI